MRKNILSKIQKFAIIIIAITAHMSFAASARIELTPQELFKNASQSITRIYAEQTKNSIAMGSGVFVKSGLVATNCHVLGIQENPTIKYKEKYFIGKVVYSSINRDLCIIDIAKEEGVPAEIFKTDEIEQGMRAFAIGSPRGLDLTISEGLISGVRTSGDSMYIQTSTPISMGSSGGGLFSSDGRLIGLTTFTLKEGQNINFALPSVWIEDALKVIVAAKQAPIFQSNNNQNIVSPLLPPEAGLWAEKAANVIKKEGFCKLPEDGQVRSEFMQTVWYEATRVGIQPSLLISLIIKISECRKHFISHNGSRGYLGINTDYAAKLGVEDRSRLFHMQTNIRVGSVILKHLQDKHKSMDDALTAYLSISAHDQTTTSHRKISKEIISISKEISAKP